MFPLLATKTIVQGLKISYLSLWFAAICLIVAIPAFLNPKKFREAIMEFANSSNTTIRLVAFLDLILAFLALNTHKTISFDNPRSVIAALGWLLFIRGIMRLWFPEWVRERMKKFLQKEYSAYIMGMVSLAFAIFFGYLGIWVY